MLKISLNETYCGNFATIADAFPNIIKYRKYEMDFSSCFSVARKTTYFIYFFMFGEITHLEMRLEKKH